MLSKQLQRCEDHIPYSSPYEKVVEQLLLKGAIFIGAGVGLYIALKVLGK
jgi:hypothetical protein